MLNTWIDREWGADEALEEKIPCKICGTDLALSGETQSVGHAPVPRPIRYLMSYFFSLYCSARTLIPRMSAALRRLEVTRWRVC